MTDDHIPELAEWLNITNWPGKSDGLNQPLPFWPLDLIAHAWLITEALAKLGWSMDLSITPKGKAFVTFHRFTRDTGAVEQQSYRGNEDNAPAAIVEAALALMKGERCVPN